jgi:putative DNA primase/helicase
VCSKLALEPGNRRVILVDDQELPEVAKAAWEALVAANDPPSLFRMGSGLWRVDADDVPPSLTKLTRDQLSYHLVRVAQIGFGQWTPAGPRLKRPAQSPPAWLIADMVAEPDPPLPVLRRIVVAPVFDPHGSLCATPGYDPGSKLYYSPAPGFAVPTVSFDPSGADTRRAVALLEELVDDFPFVGGPDRAHALGLIILPYARDMIDGPTPLHVVTAPNPGSGKTLLADVASYPFLGTWPDAMTEASNDDEWRKRLTAKLRGLPSTVVIDNVRRRIDSASLASCLTSRTWSDRLLSVNEIISVPVSCCWVVTGNNPTMSTEIARRSVRIRLDARMERPWEGRTFAKPDLKRWVVDHRGDLTWAALTLVRSWLAAGRPAAPGPVLASFEAWSAVVGGVLHHAGIPGFMGNRSEFYDQVDAEGNPWRTLVEAWSAAFGGRVVAVAELLPLATDVDDIDLGTGDERSRRTSFGKQLSGRRDQVFGGLRITPAGKKDKAQRWRLVPTGLQELPGT